MDKSRTIGEWERMVSGRLYNPADPEVAKRHRAGMLRCDRFNRIPLRRAKAKRRALEKLIPSAVGRNFEVFAPFYCEYGVNIHVGQNCFVNYKSVFLDVAPITLGNNVLIGPNVTLATPNHPFAPEERAFADYPDGHHELEYAAAITIGDNCWLSSGVTVCGGVTIGAGSIIAAGAVVTRDIPAQQYRCRCTRQSAAADRRARPPACMGEVCEERTAQCVAVTTKPGSNYKNRLKHIV